jgi:hypothetical protein
MLSGHVTCLLNDQAFHAMGEFHVLMGFCSKTRTSEQATLILYRSSEKISCLTSYYLKLCLCHSHKIQPEVNVGCQEVECSSLSVRVKTVNYRSSLF